MYSPRPIPSYSLFSRAYKNPIGDLLAGSPSISSGMMVPKNVCELRRNGNKTPDKVAHELFGGIRVWHDLFLQVRVPPSMARHFPM